MEELEEVENMRCPDLLTVSWVEIPPYIYNTTEGKLDGIFYNILTQMVQFCCPDRTNLSFAENPVTLTKFQGILDNGTDDILLPAYGTGKKKDRLGEPFISLVDSPGIAYFYGATSSAQEALIKAFLTSWPVLVVVLLFALVVGSGFWVTEVVYASSKKKKDNKKHYIMEYLSKAIEGPWDGFYWAIVTLTTVGYGDLCPKTIIGRLMAMVWILFGTVMLSMFTASITTGLITACLSNDIPLAGTKVAVMSYSQESSVAVKKNAIAINYETVEKLSHVLERGETDGLLLDSYIAGHYQELFEKFLLADVLEYVFSYGMILRNKGLWMHQCFRIYLGMKKDQIFVDISKAVKPFKPLKFGNQASEKSSTVIDWKSKSLQYLIAGAGALLAFLVIAGLILERFLKRRKRRSDFLVPQNGNGYDATSSEETLKICKQQHVNERYAMYSQLKDELAGLRTSIQGVISYTREIEQFDMDQNGIVNSNA